MAGPVYFYKCRHTGALMMNNKVCDDRPGLANRKSTEWHVKHSANHCNDCSGAIALDPPVPVYPDTYPEAAKSGMPSAGIAEAGVESAAPAKTKPPKAEVGPIGRDGRDSGPTSAILPKPSLRKMAKHTARLVEARRQILQTHLGGDDIQQVHDSARNLSDLVAVLTLLCGRSWCIKHPAARVEARRRNLLESLDGGKLKAIKTDARNLSDLTEILVLLCNR